MSGAPPPRVPIVRLTAEHDIADFDCGKHDLNRYLKRFALTNQRANAAQTYVLCMERRVIAYYSLAAGSVEHGQAPPRITRGLARHPVPVMLIARLAVDANEHGKGIGRALLKDALLRTANVADIAGVRAVLVHAKEDEARRWYQRFDFEPSPTEPYHLFLLLKDLKHHIGA